MPSPLVRTSSPEEAPAHGRQSVSADNVATSAATSTPGTTITTAQHEHTHIVPFDSDDPLLFEKLKFEMDGQFVIGVVDDVQLDEATQQRMYRVRLPRGVTMHLAAEQVQAPWCKFVLDAGPPA